MQVTLFSSVEKFRDQVFEFLCEREAENCLLIGMLDRLAKDQGDCHLWAVCKDGQVCGVAWWTPPHPLGLTTMPNEAVSALFHEIEKLGLKPAEVIGPTAAVNQYCKVYRQMSGNQPRTKFKQRIFKLTSVIAPCAVAGGIRVALDVDIQLLADWNSRFATECGLSLGADPMQRALRDAEDSVARGSRYFWTVGGEIVAMAGAAGKTPNGIRISWVYTPPQYRGQGYASAVVAALSQKMLDSGNRFCFLFTDLANPTSNSIYQKIGYQPECDYEVHSLL